MNDVITRAVARWTNPETRPLFKGSLYDRATGCMCAQGDVLFNEGGYSEDELVSMPQSRADTLTMELLGISRAHAVLLRYVNDKSDGQPQNVLTDPASVLGKHSDKVLAFWRHLDTLTYEQWREVAADADAADADAYAADADAADAADADAYAAADAADADAYAADVGDAAAADAADAGDAAAADAADAAAADAAAADAYAAGDADAAAYKAGYRARYATYEIIGADYMIERGKPFYFLRLFGFDSPDAIPA